MTSIRIAAATVAVLGLAACSAMSSSSPDTRRAASETPPGTGSVAPTITGQNSSTTSSATPTPTPR